MLEYLAPGFLYSLLKDAFFALRTRHRRLTPSDVVALRQKWKPVFEEKIWEAHKSKLRQDIIIHDMRKSTNILTWMRRQREYPRGSVLA